MSNLRRQAAHALGASIHQFVKLQEPPTVIDAPPNEVADYPRVAIWLETFARDYTQDDELEVDADGNLKVGALADLDIGAGPAIIQNGVYLSIAGTIRGSGRIWVGSRLPPKREEVEDNIDLVFLQEREAPGRLTVTIAQPKVGNFVIPWSWTAAVFLSGNSEWKGEYSFAARLWAWVKFDLEISILVPRHDPLVRRFLMTLDADFAQPIAADGTVTDLDDGADNEIVEFDVPFTV